MNHYYVYPYAPVPSYHYAPTPNHQQQLWHSNNWHPQYVAAPPATPHQHPVRNPRIRDRGKEPFVVDINNVAEDNNTFRSTIWTGKHLQATVMSIDVGEDRKSTRLHSSHVSISYAVFCLKKKNVKNDHPIR